MFTSLSHIFKIIRKHILSQNSFVMSHVKFILAMDLPLGNGNNKKRSHTQLDSRKQVIAFQERVITINIKEAQHPLK